MSETPTLYEPSIDNPEALAAGFERRLDTYGPDFSQRPSPVDEPVETKPISWDGPHDPKNPQNWSTSRKWLVMAVNGIITVNVYVLREFFFFAATS